MVNLSLRDESNVIEALDHSNRIENVWGYQALTDAKAAFTYLLSFHGLTIPAITEAHRGMLGGINPQIAGKMRDNSRLHPSYRAVQVGGRICPPHSSIKALLKEWLKTINSKPLSSSDLKATHIKFEHIHPFPDGNGRIGRMIMYFLALRDGLPLAEHIIHHGEEQMSYYGWFDSGA